MPKIKVVTILCFLDGVPNSKYTISKNYILREFLDKAHINTTGIKGLILDVSNKTNYQINQEDQLLKEIFQGYNKWMVPGLEKRIQSIQKVPSKFNSECIQVKVYLEGFNQINEGLGLEESDSINNQETYTIYELCRLPIIFDFLPKDQTTLSSLTFLNGFTDKKIPNGFWFETAVVNYAPFGNNTLSEIKKIRQEYIDANYFSKTLDNPIVSELQFYGKTKILERISEREENIKQLQALANNSRNLETVKPKIIQQGIVYEKAELKRLLAILKPGDN